MAEEKSTLTLLKSPLSGDNSRHGPAVDDAADMATYDVTLFDNPEFEHHEETSNIQLFFDLFFVANLTSFTNAHEINSIPALSSYIGFFTVLWITWVQVTLYDVRFATDSVFERLAHACHFGVMVGLAVIGPQFNDPNADPVPWAVMQQLSLILMASRVVLVCQYGTTLFFVWRYRDSRKPIAAVVITLSVAVILYLGVSFAFYNETAHNAYIAWYVIGVVEVASNLFIAKFNDSISFQNTHLIERMTCLTLIILGEGIIGLTKTIAKIETLDFSFSPSAIGGIISATLIIYFIYQLYFDNVRLEPFNSLRQLLWAGLHFPFHMALVLLMEGINQIFVWSHIVEDLDTQLNNLINIPASDNKEQYFSAVNDTVNYVFNTFPSDESTYLQVEDALDFLSSNTNSTIEQVDSAVGQLMTGIGKVIFEGFGWEAPETEGESEESGNYEDIILKFYQQYLNVFSISFAYFCISAGVVLIGIGIFTYLSYKGDAHHRHRFTRYSGIIVTLLVGLGLTLLSTAVLTNASQMLGNTPWTLPLLLLLLLILLFVNHVPDGSGGRKHRKGSVERIHHHNREK